MNDFEKKCVVLIREICQRSEKTLSENYIKSWLKSCKKLDEKKAINALTQIYRKAKQGYQIPSIYEFEQLANEQEESNLFIADKIIQAMSLFGSYKNDDAKKFIGEIGWKIVQKNGGWQNMCYFTDTKYLHLLKKDLSKQIKQIIHQDNFKKLIAN
ncbi:MAG: hypothetical protein DCC88_00135 [Spirobacillus cienkowskii]|uniref:Uncharacterized protein n=1 Tax=Spirobacillus cienkowskii TaxID=495820 RepID=A0A369KUC6_9BACT|nr:MAG: hypothetical protein DCC88_00135 [Spirobacillus cienkowskii]